MQLTKQTVNLPAKIEDLTKFILIGREKLVAVRASIRAIDKIGLAKEVREQKREEANWLAGALLDAEAKLGGLIKETDKQKSYTGFGRRKAVLPEGITHKQSSAFQILDANKDIIEQVKADAEAEDDIPTRTEVLRRVKEKEHKDKFDAIKKDFKSADLPNKKYNIIYADPAWQYFEGGHKNQSQHYGTMSIEDIKNLKINEISADDCILFIWVTFPILDKCFDVITAWGFEYSTCGFVWVKTNKKTDTPFFGLGSWTRANAELCLIATRGHIKRLDASVSQVIMTPIEEHSKKPDIVRNKIIQLVGDLPRIELFARDQKEGFEVWGNQIKN